MVLKGCSWQYSEVQTWNFYQPCGLSFYKKVLHSYVIIISITSFAYVIRHFLFCYINWFYWIYHFLPWWSHICFSIVISFIKISLSPISICFLKIKYLGAREIERESALQNAAPFLMPGIAYGHLTHTLWPLSKKMITSHPENMFKMKR